VLIRLRYATADKWADKGAEKATGIRLLLRALRPSPVSHLGISHSHQLIAISQQPIANSYQPTVNSHSHQLSANSYHPFLSTILA
jgi:hypothetical protein